METHGSVERASCKKYWLLPTATFLVIVRLLHSPGLIVVVVSARKTTVRYADNCSSQQSASLTPYTTVSIARCILTFIVEEEKVCLIIVLHFCIKCDELSQKTFLTSVLPVRLVNGSVVRLASYDLSSSYMNKNVMKDWGVCFGICTLFYRTVLRTQGSAPCSGKFREHLLTESLSNILLMTVP